MNDLEELGFVIVHQPDPQAEDIISSYADTLFVNKEKKILNENEFACCFRDINKLQYSNGLFYTNVGKKSEDLIAKDIWKSIADLGIVTNVDTHVRKLLGAVKLAATIENLKPDEDVIPFANGDLDIKKMVFYEGRFNPSPYRLPISLPYNFPPTPNFKKWLNDLLDSSDQWCFRQYLGYCLIPTTKAQKALFLVGEGGAGKSVLGVILRSLLGEAVVSTANTQEFMADKFKLPELENKLVLYDDDLDNAALSSTGLYKKLITNTQPITADRKFGQPFKFTPKIKLIACCNEMITSSSDMTTGFFRRLLPMVIKPIAADFKPDLKFYDKIQGEAQGILGFALEGLLTLIASDYELKISDRTNHYLGDLQGMSNPIPIFFNTCFDFDKDFSVTSAKVKAARDYWCRKNDIDPKTMVRFDKWISDNAEKYGVQKCNNVYDNGARLRGIVGCKLKPEWEMHLSKITV